MSQAPGFLADEDFHNAILRGLARRVPELDIVRVQDVGLAGALDPAILDWAAQHDRVVLTHDTSTMSAYAYDRLRVRLRLAGVCVISQSLSIGQAIDEILLVAQCSTPDDWEGLVRYLPL